MGLIGYINVTFSDDATFSYHSVTLFNVLILKL